MALPHDQPVGSGGTSSDRSDHAGDDPDAARETRRIEEMAVDAGLLEEDLIDAALSETLDNLEAAARHAEHDALLPVARPVERATEELHDPRLTDVDEWGR